ncbi:MAG: hypothetical protein ACYCX8_12590, partial [Acidimicrobiales bacterium]
PPKVATGCNSTGAPGAALSFAVRGSVAHADGGPRSRLTRFTTLRTSLGGTLPAYRRCRLATLSA